jgi:predicted dehydrogenase
MVEPIRVGVVGCGQITQIMHLPFLTTLPQFRVSAVCDLSPLVVAAVGERFGVPVRTTDYRELIDRDDVDAVAVLCMEHGEVAVAAAEAGKHLFIEKPLGFSPAEADRIIAAVDRAGVMAMIGFMRRYDPGYELGAARMRAMQDVRLIRVHDFAGDFRFLTSLFPIVTRDDLSPELRAERQSAIEAERCAALGPTHAHLSELYNMLIMLASHDLSALRGAFGPPAGVLYSDAVAPTAILSVLDYGRGRRCVFEAGTGSRYHWWDQQLTAYGEDEIVEIAFANPYMPHAPAVVTVRVTKGGSPVRTEIQGSHDEAFRREWEHFAACLRSGNPPRTTLADARADLVLALAMIHAIPAPAPER